MSFDINNLQAMKVNFRNRKIHLNMPKNDLVRAIDKKQSESLRTEQSNQKVNKQMTSFGSNVKPPSQGYQRMQIDHSKHNYIDNIVDTIHLIGQQYISYLNQGKQQRFRAAILSNLTKLQARDRSIILQYNFQLDNNGQAYFDFQKEQQRLKQWLGQVHFRIVSTSFDFQINKMLTYEQIKVYCSQNLLLNIILFLQKVQTRITGISLTKLMLYIDEILHQNLQYLMVKYPQAKQMKPNKRLRAQIQPINNIENDVNDLLQYSGIKFVYDQSQNYNSQIMKFMNYIIQIMTSTIQLQNYQYSFAQGFSQIIQQLFSQVYIPEAYQKQLQTKNLPMQQYKKQLANLFQNNIQVKQYKQKVSKYTSYKIGTKINPNTQLFSDSEIKAGFFQIKSTSILRILTKWIQQLQKKIFQAKDYLQKRSFRFKSNKVSQKKQYNKLSASQKNDLYLQATKQVYNLKRYIQNIRQNAFSIQGQLALSMERTKQKINIPKKQYLVGQFSSKLQDAASSSLLSYLNQIIHILLLIPKNIKQKYKHDEQALNEVDIDLVTFKISDLLRCKISSHQNQILRVYKNLKKLSDNKDYFKIVRIKDRLQLGTRDILINGIYMNKMLCQIQLAITDQIDTKQQAFDAFNHYLYELRRANLGCVMQSACIWAHFDQRSRQIQQYGTGSVKRVIHKCITQLVDNNLPFVCSICSKFYFSQQGIIRHKKCIQCNKYFRCALCFECKMNEQQLKQFLGLNKALGIFSDQFVQWTSQQYPLHGLIIPKKNKSVQILFFSTTLWKQDAYIIRSFINGNQNQSKVVIQVLTIIKNNDLKQWRKLKQNYIIYEWTQRRKINLTIKPQSAARQKLDQELKKQQEQRQKRQKRQREIQQIKKKWKFKTKGKDKSRPGSSDSDGSRHSEQSKYSKASKLSQQQTKKKTKSKPAQLPKNKYGNNYFNGLQKIEEIQKIYNQNIQKLSDLYQVRVALKKQNTQNQLKQQNYLILGPYCNQKQVRSQLKRIYNHKIVRQNLQRKMEVLFLQDLMIQGQLDDLDQKQNEKYNDSFSKINQIYLDSNKISQIDFLQKMPKLNVVHLNYNAVYSMESFKQLKQITQLMLQYNEISSIEGIQHNQKLIELNLNHNNIELMKGFEGLKKLQILSMADNKCKKIQNLDDLTNLKKLDLAFNYIQKIQGLTNLTKLQQLDLSQNLISVIQNLQSLQSLKKLYMYKNKISKLQGLNKCNQLKFLDLHRNKLTKIQNIQQLQNLVYLNLGGNRIRKIQGLTQNINLLQLNLSSNQISTLKNLISNNLLKLKCFDISYNAIKQLIDQLFEFLPQLQQFYLNSNPLVFSKSQIKIYQQLNKKFKLKQNSKFYLNFDHNQTVDTQSDDQKK